MLAIVVILILITPSVWVVRRALHASRLDEEQFQARAREEYDFYSPEHHPSRSQKGDPGGYSWPWELTTSDGPDEDAQPIRER